MTNSRTNLIGVAVLVALPCATYGQAFPWFDRVEITSTEPEGLAAVTLGGTWIDTCAPDAISHQITGRQIELRVTQPGLNTGCGDALTDWTLTEEIGPLETGAYEVTGSLIAVDPTNRNTRQQLFGPDHLGSIQPFRAQFDGLGTNDLYNSRASDVSADGRVVVGTNGLAPGNAAFITSQAFAWTPETGQIDLGLLPGGIPGGSSAWGVSADGNSVVGSSTSSIAGSEAFRWTLGGGMQGIGSRSVPHSVAQAASADGEVLVGLALISPSTTMPFRHRSAFRWTANTGFDDLGHLSDLEFTEAFDTASDGNTIVGSSRIDTSLGIARRAFLWEPTDGIHDLGVLEPAVDNLAADAEIFQESVANAISANNEIVVGFSGAIATSDPLSPFPISRQAFRWTEETRMVALPPPSSADGFDVSMEAIDVSGDGSIVVGMVEFTPTGPAPLSDDISAFAPQREPFIWDQRRGTRLLREVLQRDAGLLLDDSETSWELGEVTAISDNGTTIVGYGTNPDGQTEAWRAVLLHSFSAGDTDFSGSVDFADFLTLASNFAHAEPQYWSTGDFSADGQVAFDDFLALAQNFAPSTSANSTGTQQVPEPTGAWLILLGTLVLTYGSRRRRR